MRRQTCPLMTNHRVGKSVVRTEGHLSQARKQLRWEYSGTAGKPLPCQMDCGTSIVNINHYYINTIQIEILIVKIAVLNNSPTITSRNGRRMNWTPDMQRWAVATPYVLRWTEGQLGENNFFISSDPDKSKAMLIFFHKKVPLPLPLQSGDCSKRRPGLLFRIKYSAVWTSNSFFVYFVISSIQVNYIQKGECYDISESKSNQF